MAYYRRRYRKKGFRKKTYRKRTYAKRPYKKAKMYKSLGLPETYYCRLRYVDDFRFAATNTEEWALIGINSLYDPMQSVETGYSNKQPIYFDQLASVYDLYAVTECTCTIQVYNQNSTNPLTLIMMPNRLSSSPASGDISLAGNKYCKTSFITDEKLCKMSTTVSINRMLSLRGITGLIGGGGASYVTANPGTMAYMHIGIMNPTGVSETFNVFVKVQLDFKAAFFRNRTLAD